jgi:hypothetical protein
MSDTERFILFCGREIEPWVYTDEPFKVTRAEAIRLIVTKEVKDPPLIMAFDLVAGTCRPATAEIMEAARALMDDEPPAGFDHIAAQFDHARDLRKHEVV